MEKKERVWNDKLCKRLRCNQADTLCLHLTYNANMFSCETDKISDRFPAGVQNYNWVNTDVLRVCAGK